MKETAAAATILRQDAKMRKIAGFLIAVLAIIVVVKLAGLDFASHPTQPVTTSALRSSEAIGVRTSSEYTVVGNTIETAAGKQLVVHGVNRSSLENSCTGASVTGQQTGIPASDFATMHNAWGATVVRLPLDQYFWLSNCRGYRATVKRAVREIQTNHMIAILDLHWWTVPPNLSFATGAYGMCMPNQSSRIFWRQVATTYQQDPGVWFELYNEPAPLGDTRSAQWAVWRNGGNVSCDNDENHTPMGSFNAAGMQELVDTIRDTGATNIVIADGIDKAFTLQGVPPLSGGNIAYAIHPYDPDPSYSALGWGESDWDARFGDPAKKVPVIATEFGDSECGDTTSAHAYDREILDYFAAHHISYLAWDWFAAYPCDVPELITNAAGVCRESMGCVIQQALKSFARQRASRSKR